MTEARLWIDGAVLGANHLAVPLAGDASLRGINVFEGIKAYRSSTSLTYCIVSLYRHLSRLAESAALMHLPAGSLVGQVEGAIRQLLEGETDEEVYLRPTVYLKSGYYGEKIEAGMFVLARSVVGSGAAVRCKISDFDHLPGTSYPSQAKIGAMYAFFRLARLEAARSGADEAILLATDGSVAETPGASVFVLKNGVAFTPPLSVGILPSITRITAMGILRDQIGIEVVEQRISVEQLTCADEIFLTGTLDEIRAVSSVNGREIGDGGSPVTSSLRDAYLVACRSGIPAPPAGSAWVIGGRRG